MCVCLCVCVCVCVWCLCLCARIQTATRLLNINWNVEYSTFQLILSNLVAVCTWIEDARYREHSGNNEFGQACNFVHALPITSFMTDGIALFLSERTLCYRCSVDPTTFSSPIDAKVRRTNASKRS